jgi:hypothetical protein
LVTALLSEPEGLSNDLASSFWHNRGPVVPITIRAGATSYHMTREVSMPDLRAEAFRLTQFARCAG